MSRWLPFAGLADQYRNRPFHLLFGNPFKFHDGVVPKTVEALEKTKLVQGRPNFTVLRQITHPEVDRHGSGFVPGWNASNREILANGEHACFVLFDRSGEIVFRGRLTFEAAEARVAALLRGR